MSLKTKKRKRGEDEFGSEEVTFAVMEEDVAAVGPVFASFPAIQPPNSTAFNVYSRQAILHKDGEADFAYKSIHIAGETETVEFYSTNEVGRGCRYLVGVRNKKTNIVVLRPAPLQLMARRVKVLKGLAAEASTNATERIEQRNVLGETFGTKKAQKAIRAAERNKIDVSAMQGVTGHIQNSITTNTSSLPSKAEAEALADSHRQIPPHDLHASVPENVYKLHDIVPEAEFNAIPIAGILSAKTMEERLNFVPMRRSIWIRQHLELLFKDGTPSKRMIKVVMYVACLMAFRSSAAKLCNNREALQQRLQGMPSIVVDGILSHFTETLRGSNEAKFTSDNQVSLLTYMLALCLHADRFVTDVETIAKDLSEPTTKIIQHFKMLGCRISKLNAAEMSQLGVSTLSEDNKRAILRLPLEFPKARVKRRN